MARVFIPPALRALTNGQAVVDVSGSTVREVLDRLDALYPGTRAQLCRDDHLKPGLMVAIDSAMAGTGLQERVQPDSEIHFLPTIGGG